MVVMYRIGTIKTAFPPFLTNLSEASSRTRSSMPASFLVPLSLSLVPSRGTPLISDISDVQRRRPKHSSVMKKKQSSSYRRYHDKDYEGKKKKRKKKTMIVEFDNVDIIEDLILEILLHLPPISVLRFKCVCKKWYSLISNPGFLRSHSSVQFHKHTDLLVHAYAKPMYPIDKPFELVCLPQDKNQPPLLKSCYSHLFSLFPGNPLFCFIEDSCNGLLLLLLCYKKDKFSEKNNITYYIFNLITKHYLKLPNTVPIPKIREEELEAHTYIMFDPSVSLSFKVIRWFEHENGIPYYLHYQLYSSETSSWRLLSINFPIEVDFDFNSRPTLLNGVLYWSYWSTPLDVSYCFDVEKESVSSLPLPPKPIRFDYRLCLHFGECAGRLRLIEKYLKTLEFVDPLSLPCSFDVLEMEPEQHPQQRQDGCSPWILKYHVNMEMGLKCHVVREHPLQVAFIHFYKLKNKRGDEEEALFLNINQTYFVSYNLTNNTFGQELTFSESTSSCERGFRHFFPFTPTLFPIS